MDLKLPVKSVIKSTTKGPDCSTFLPNNRFKPMSFDEAMKAKKRFDNIDMVTRDCANKKRNEEIKRSRITDLYIKSGIHHDFFDKSFDNYHALGADQTKVLNTCKQYALNFKEKLKVGTSLVFVGNTGTGKTHLACAIANFIIKQRGRVKYTTFAKMIRDIRASWSDKKLNEQEIINGFTRPILLIIDEIGVQYKTDSEKNQLFEIINERRSRPLPTILISNYKLDEVEMFIGKRSARRLKEAGGSFLPFAWKTYQC